MLHPFRQTPFIEQFNDLVFIPSIDFGRAALGKERSRGESAHSNHHKRKKGLSKK
jgi:hypothetical protein